MGGGRFGKERDESDMKKERRRESNFKRKLVRKKAILYERTRKDPDVQVPAEKGLAIGAGCKPISYREHGIDQPSTF